MTDHPDSKGVCERDECHCRNRAHHANCSHFRFEFGREPVQRYAAAVTCERHTGNGPERLVWADVVAAPSPEWAQLVAINNGRRKQGGHGHGFAATVVPIP